MPQFNTPLPPGQERRAVGLALALFPLGWPALTYLHNAGGPPRPHGGRRDYHPAITRAGWLLCCWLDLAETGGTP